MKRALALAVALTLASAAGRASADDAAPDAPAPAVARPAPPVRVHLRSWRDKVPARMYVYQGQDRWAFVCASPCAADLAAGAGLRIMLGDSEEAHEMVVPQELGPQVDLEVRPASKGPLAGGIVMTSIGGLVAVVGLVLVAVASSDSVPDRADIRTAGLVCLGVGGGLTLGGIALISNRSQEPRVRQDPHVEKATRDAALLPGVTTPFGVGLSF